MTDLYYPLQSLREGHWFKLICGASFQHLPAIRNLVLAYTLAGADCIDVAADPAVVSTARSALAAADRVVKETGCNHSLNYKGSPWLMVSLNDGEDPHFRKAEFEPNGCLANCSRPCEAVCPAEAIVFKSGYNLPVLDSMGTAAVSNSAESFSGVISDRCYGCGRCIPICPIQHISTRSFVSTPAAIAPLVLQTGVDAIEIHTQIGRLQDFQRLWTAIAPWVGRLKLVSISCPDGHGLTDYLWKLYEVMSPLSCPVVWQTDGRPMSGDIGVGTTKAAVRLGQKVLAASLPGYVQLAGGTNHHTVAKLRSLGLLNTQFKQSVRLGDEKALPSSADSNYPTAYISGVAYGSYARTLLAPVLNQLDALKDEADTIVPNGELLRTAQRASGITVSVSHPSRAAVDSFKPIPLETIPNLLWQAVDLAHSLVSPLKTIGRR